MQFLPWTFDIDQISECPEGCSDCNVAVSAGHEGGRAQRAAI